MKVASRDFECSVVSRNKPTWKILFPAPTFTDEKTTAALKRPVQAGLSGCPVLALEGQLLEGVDTDPHQRLQIRKAEPPLCRALRCRTRPSRNLGLGDLDLEQPSGSLGKGGQHQPRDVCVAPARLGARP